MSELDTLRAAGRPDLTHPWPLSFWLQPPLPFTLLPVRVAGFSTGRLVLGTAARWLCVIIMPVMSVLALAHAD